MSNPSACQNCVDFDERCTFDRPIRQRGKPPKIVTASNTAKSTVNGAQESSDWTPKLAITQALVTDLTEIFFEVVYPVFPLFHRASLTRRVSRGEHLENRSLYASVMAMCALSSARARDGALLQCWDVAKLQNPSSEELFDAAVNAFPEDLLDNQSLDYMRASMLLSITAIQYGSPALMNYHLSRYHTYVTVGALHDEANWPQALPVIEVEERRRLFWSAYTLDVFTSVVWSGVIRSKEASSNVCYPTEIDDEALEFLDTATAVQSVTWLRGWNYVTDMYRILEYAASDLQRTRTTVLRRPTIEALEDFKTSSQSAVLDRITAMYADLPDVFKTTAQPTHNFRRDLFSFQAANIAATVQLVRMVYFSSDASDLEQKCRVASEVLTAFANMPVAYLRAISAPLLHHLAEIGRIFGAAFVSGMSASLYHSVRSVLLDLASILADLEQKLYCPSNASKKVESQVMRIDRFIHEQRQVPTEHVNPLHPSAAPEILSASEPTLEQPSPDIMFPPELFEDWDWAFTFT